MAVIGFSQVSFAPDFEDTLENVKAALGHVDFIVVVEDGSFTPEQKKTFTDLGVHLVYKSWDDNFPAYRNASIGALQELGCDWAIISDADEHHSPELWRDLKDKIIPRLEAKGFNEAGIRCIDAWKGEEWLDDLDQLKELPGGHATETDWYKNLLFRLYPDVEYSGHGGVVGIGGAKRLTYKCEKCGNEEVVYR